MIIKTIFVTLFSLCILAMPARTRVAVAGEAMLAVEYNSLVVDGSAEKGNDDRNTKSIVDLYNEFTQDPQTMSRRYAGERIDISGVVIFTGPDIHHTPSVELSDAIGGKRYAVCVVNSFDQLEGISVGDSVRITGNFHIFVQREWGVVLKQCEVSFPSS